MTVYAVVFDTDEPPDHEARLARIVEQYPGLSSYQHTNSLYLVNTEDVSSEVKRKLAIGKDNESGIVFRIDKVYTGYTSVGLWEWLAKAIAP